MLLIDHRVTDQISFTVLDPYSTIGVARLITSISIGDLHCSIGIFTSFVVGRVNFTLAICECQDFCVIAENSNVCTVGKFPLFLRVIGPL